MTTQEQILMTILKCGTLDLMFLDKIGYDVDEIVEDLMDNGILSYNAIWQEVFYKAILDLTSVIQDKKEEIIEEIQAKLDEEQDGIKNGEYAEEELEEFPEHQKLIADMELITSGELDDLEDCYDYYLNYIDTHIYLKHLDFFEEYLSDDIDDLEEKMGVCFEYLND